MGRRLGERISRFTRRTAVLAAGSVLVSACGYQMEREPIDFNKPVGSMTPVATAPTPPSTVPGPSYETNLTKSINMLVCLGAFVDKLHKKVTVLPVSSYTPDSTSVFPMRVELKESGGSEINPESAPYAATDYSWYDLNGKELGNTPPKCEQRPVRKAKILLPHINQPDMALVGPCTDDEAVLGLERAAVAEANDIYSRQFPYETHNDLLAIMRDLQATVIR